MRIKGIKIDEDVQRILNEEDANDANEFPKGSFAEWFGEDLTGQTYEGSIDCEFCRLTSLYGAPKEVKGNFFCSYNRLKSLVGAPEQVKGIFNCSYNGLTTLEGAPEYVGSDFNCSYNNLMSLTGAPKEVKGYFDCASNFLTSLEGAPERVEDWFDCSYNDLTSLEGAPEHIGGYIDCSYNKLTTLEGAPKEVKGTFICSYNHLTTLEGAPEHVESDFDCSYNHLVSLEGAPEYVGNEFNCSNNQLTSLKGAPKEVEGEFSYTNNPDLESLEGVGEVEDDKCTWQDWQEGKKYACIEDIIYGYIDDFVGTEEDIEKFVKAGWVNADGEIVIPAGAVFQVRKLHTPNGIVLYYPDVDMELDTGLYEDDDTLYEIINESKNEGFISPAEKQQIVQCFIRCGQDIDKTIEILRLAATHFEEADIRNVCAYAYVDLASEDWFTKHPDWEEDMPLEAYNKILKDAEEILGEKLRDDYYVESANTID